MATSIYTSQTPGVPNDNEGGGITVGTVFSSAVDGTISQIRWFFPTTLPGVPVQGAVYLEGPQTQLATATFSSTPTAGTWNTATLNTPVNVVAGTNYVVAVWSDSRYVATVAQFNGSSITNGDLTAPADDPGGIRNGRFSGGGALQYPSNSFNGNGYFADVLFEPEGDATIEPDGITIPVTLGEPALSQTFTVAPDGISIPVTLGEPALTWSATVAPDGISIPVTLGSPSVSGSGDLTIAPDGISIPVTLGTPTLTFATPPSPLGPDLALAVGAFAKDCLCDAVALLTVPPLHCRYQVGAEGFAGVGVDSDECCEGVAYTALGDIYPSWTSFPDADIVRQVRGNCVIAGWAVDIKLGIIRCAPTGTDMRPPTDEEWNAAALLGYADAQALRRAACCIRSGVDDISTQFPGMSVVIGRQSQGPTQGGCMERYVTITVQFPNCETC